MKISGLVIMFQFPFHYLKYSRSIQKKKSTKRQRLEENTRNIEDFLV